MARPKLNEEDKRTINLSVSVNESEHDKIVARAKKSNRSKAEYIREASVNPRHIRIVPEVSRESAQEITKIHSAIVSLAAILERSGSNDFDAVLFMKILNILRLLHQDFLGYGDNKNNQR